MGYHDRVYGASDSPPCWGRTSTYDPSDPECQDCRWLHSCREEVECSAGGYRRGFRSQPARTTRRRESQSGVEDVNYDRSKPVEVEVIDKDTKQMVKKPQSAGERFFKDAVGGALRGAFYEMYEFWKRYRIP